MAIRHPGVGNQTDDHGNHFVWSLLYCHNFVIMVMVASKSHIGQCGTKELCEPEPKTEIIGSQDENEDQADENESLQNKYESLQNKQKLAGRKRNALDENETPLDENEIPLNENETKHAQPQFADLACDIFAFVQVLVHEWCIFKV
ncbi:hypothetical protein GGX14DRAFT_407147 [Mycena pura]|uniref:Uncharacterized protein n=1 Tax=Mycena pura TaxID=153505 RepID=A0AAD6UT17_9AGAR|nr:hypothetical protein GGX14DRAFT_407147 [Mycena pura]